MSEAQHSRGSERYSVAEVARLFDLPEARIRYWSQTGFITPSERVGGRRYYSFTDLLALKVAKELLDAGHPLQRVRRGLDALRERVPGDASPLSRLRVRSHGGRITVEDAIGRYEADTGQSLLDFDVESIRARVAEVRAMPWVERGPAEQDEPESGYAAFLRARALEGAWVTEDGTPGTRRFEATVAAYERALELDPGLAAAWTNLGALLASVGELERARDAFDSALACDEEQAEARCNLAELALRDGEYELAIEGFRRVIQQLPECFEAHYGLARALLGVGGRDQARAHLERFARAVDALPPDARAPELEQRRAQVEAVLRSLGSA